MIKAAKLNVGLQHEKSVALTAKNLWKAICYIRTLTTNQILWTPIRFFSRNVMSMFFVLSKTNILYLSFGCLLRSKLQLTWKGSPTLLIIFPIPSETLIHWNFTLQGATARRAFKYTIYCF